MTFLKLMTRRVAKQPGLELTSIRKPYAESRGSGVHFNMSLERFNTGMGVEAIFPALKGDLGAVLLPAPFRWRRPSAWPTAHTRVPRSSIVNDMAIGRDDFGIRVRGSMDSGSRTRHRSSKPISSNATAELTFRGLAGESIMMEAVAPVALRRRRLRFFRKFGEAT